MAMIGTMITGKRQVQEIRNARRPLAGISFVREMSRYSAGHAAKPVAVLVRDCEDWA